jgi:hypothetical protein
MSLRDHFAASVLSGLDQPPWKGTMGTAEEQLRDGARKLAHYAYLVADAMLSERRKGARKVSDE